MSHRTLRISRRKLLQIGGVAPLAVLLTRTASAEPACDAAADVHTRVIDTLWNLGHAYNDKVEEGKFRGVAKTLWLYLEAGARAAGKCLPSDPEVKAALADAAYRQLNHCKQRSGDLITDSVPDWDPHDLTTNGCAYLCGYYSAEAALDVGTEVDATAYTLGYKRTERQMKETLARFRSRPGEEPRACPSRGAGC